jgi:hypothetical protein
MRLVRQPGGGGGLVPGGTVVAADADGVEMIGNYPQAFSLE